MEPSRLAPLALLLLAALAGPAAAGPVRVDGSWQLEGRNARGTYRGTATLTQDAQGNVEGELALVYQAWSWMRFRYVPSGKLETARLRGRIEGHELVGERRADGIAGVVEGGLPVRYRIELAEQENLHGSRILAVSGSYGRSRERLEDHRPTGTSTAQRERGLRALVKDLEEATRGLLYVSESDHPFQVVVREDAADYVRNVEDLKRELRIPAYRPGQAGTLQGTLGKRAQHRPGETPEEAAQADRYAALLRLLGERLQDVRVYRVAGPDATVNGQGDLVGAIDVYVVGRTSDGDLVGLRTVSVET